MKRQRSMVYSREMRKYLKRLKRKRVSLRFRIIPIERKRNCYGEEYFRYKNDFCFSDKKVRYRGKKLSEYEYEGNEYYIPGKNVEKLLVRGLEIVKGLECQMKIKYLKTKFDIILIIDEGDLEEEPCLWIHFYKVRKGFHLFDTRRINEWNQPVIIFRIR